MGLLGVQRGGMHLLKSELREAEVVVSPEVSRQQV